MSQDLTKDNIPSLQSVSSVDKQVASIRGQTIVFNMLKFRLRGRDADVKCAPAMRCLADLLSLRPLPLLTRSRGSRRAPLSLRPGLARELERQVARLKGPPLTPLLQL